MWKYQNLILKEKGGVMFREDKFPSNSGMILIYPKLDLYSLWLLNIQYNLDIMSFK